MADNSGLDLFGDPIQPDREARGRPEHRWTLQNSNKVLLAFARGLSVKEAAIVIGVSAPTLRKVYFSEVRRQKDARLRMEMTQLSRLNDAAQAGNVAAEKELLKQIEKAALKDVANSVRDRGRGPKAPALGKKELAQEAAKEAAQKFKPRQGPRLLN